ncbi:hypothetical protein RM549_05730 [Salegentibacter sp. F188]|uniref:Uncharacterized protein n=1 Tax=Autumnicola patrickiae TaxID=3075591 RepID=A0ABU3E034_9FLAO|nr:hypothetical protein [Salegentibacter sp. F188]MDT0689275.1 hypothetical protein [Salegentibacter sp. F188]
MAIIAGSLVLLGVILIILNQVAESKLKNAVDAALAEAGGSYEDINVNLLGGSVEANEVKLKLEEKTVEASAIQLDGIGIIEYLRTGNIEIGEIIINDPRFVVDNGKKDTVTEKSSEKDKKFKENISIENVKLTNAEIRILQKDSTDKLYSKFSNFELQKVKIDSNTIKAAIPFKFEQYKLQNDSLFFQLNDLHTLTAENINAENGHFEVVALKMLPRYNKEEHQQQIPYEKDRYNFSFSSIELKDLSWSIENDTLHLLNPYMEVNEPNMEIYRDKLQPDDPRGKDLYSKTIRELPVKIKFDSIALKDGYIVYEENTRPSRPAGAVDFSNFDATIYNFTNIGMDKPDFPKTEIDVQTLLFENAPLKVHWEFDVSNLADRFQISGNLGSLASTQIDEFLKPAMNVTTSGSIEDMQFNFSGNDDIGSGDLRLSYKDFKVEVLKDDGTEKNSFLSAIANLVIDNTTSEDREFKDVEVERNKKKSFWNFLWLFIRDGAIKTLI